MSKLLKFRISKAISSSFHSCRSKDPCTLPQHPVPSFLQNTQFFTIDHLLFEKMIHQDNESQLISTHHDHFPIITSPSFKHHVSVTPITAAGQCSSRNGEAFSTTSDDSHTRSPSHEFKWKNEEDKWQHFVKTTSDDDTKQQPRRKISYPFIYDDSDNDEVLAEINKRQNSRKKKISTSKTKFLMMMNTTSPSSSVNENEINFTSRKANWDYYENIDITNEDEEDETETFISSSCKSHVEFSDDSSSNFSQEFDTIYKNTTRRCQKKIGYSKRRDVKNTRSNVSRGMNNIGKRLSISTSTTSSDGELPPRLSVFKKLIPCNVEGKVNESFAIVKKSEDPYEDFKSSMMEMILEKKMFEKNDLEQLLQCFLSLNAKNCHGVIVEAFSEIWKTLFSPNHN
ncbi:transcription repressor OFP7-like isoform X2 [Solanum stenotomum]|uniref:transcription repressor OFP7-like isoform X2 n=1 Tax=Solanum stenotomum TaxID=172797 RepID=UPI0020D01B44|nr:transcription repressor OFP7-like isoform X2 [Solanum stenotomum]